MVPEDGASRSEPGAASGRTPFEWMVEGLAWVGVIGPFLLVAQHWDALPDQMPSHFDSGGRPDALRPKGIVLLLPFVSLVICSILSVLSLVPQAFDYPWEVERDREPDQLQIGREMVGVMKMIISWSVVWITWRTIQVGLGQQTGLGGVFVPVLLLALGGVVAVYMARFYRISKA